MITITELRMLPTGVLPFVALIFSAPVFPAAGDLKQLHIWRKL